MIISDDKSRSKWSTSWFGTTCAPFNATPPPISLRCRGIRDYLRRVREERQRIKGFGSQSSGHNTSDLSKVSNKMECYRPDPSTCEVAAGGRYPVSSWQQVHIKYFEHDSEFEDICAIEMAVVTLSKAATPVFPHPDPVIRA